MSDPEVRDVVEARWKGGPPPDQKIVSPKAIFDSGQLVKVFAN